MADKTESYLYGNKLSSIDKSGVAFSRENLGIVSFQKGGSGSGSLGSSNSESNNDFGMLFQRLSFSRSERDQVVNCFDDTTHVYFFGRNVNYGTFTALAIIDQGHLQDFLYDYDNNFRAYVGQTFSVNIQRGETFRAILKSLTWDINARNSCLVEITCQFYGLKNNDTVFSVGSS